LPKKSKKSSALTPRGIDAEVNKRIQEFCEKNNCQSEEVIDLIKFALEPALPKEPTDPDEMTVAQIKNKVAKAWGKTNYLQLSKDPDWNIYHKKTGLNGRLRETWTSYFREWVGFPNNERNLKPAYGVVNGIDIFKNFRPWEVFEVNRKTATKDQIQAAFRKLSMKYHPDKTPNPKDRDVFEKLVEMRDSIIAVFES